MNNKELEKLKFHIKTLNNIISKKRNVDFLQNIIDFDLSSEDVRLIWDIFKEFDDMAIINEKVKEAKIDINEGMVEILKKSFEKHIRG